MDLGTLRDKPRERRIIRGRLLTAGVIGTLLFLLLAGRIAWLQTVQYDHFAAQSQNNRVRIAAVAPTRGLIRDHRGHILAENQPAFRLTIVPERTDDLAALIDEIDALIGVSDAERDAFNDARRRGRGFQAVPLKLQLSDRAVARIAVNRHRFPGVEVQPHLVRHYPYGPIGAHAVGYVGRINESELRERDRRRYRGSSVLGKTGVEKAYEDRLRGEMGSERIETNALGRPINVIERDPPVPGEDLTLTLDIDLQRVAEQALGERRGAVVALDPRTGAIRALASQPSFDPNQISQGLDRATFQALQSDVDQPLFNRAIAGRYPPGSLVKPFLGIAGVASGAVDVDEEIYSDGTYRLPNVSRVWRDWKRGGHGEVDLEKAIVESVDSYYYELARRMGIDAMHDWMTRFGFGLESGVDLPGERQGIMPSREWKTETLGEPWYQGETLNTGIGQGFMLATPIQLATSTAMLANRGAPIRPHLIDTGDESAPSPVKTRPLMLEDETLWQTTINGMVDVVHGDSGTARGINEGLDYRIAGKTGTSQVINIPQGEEYDEDEIEQRFRDHAMFTAFTPVTSPGLVVTVLVENGGSGGGTAAPVAREVMDAWRQQQETGGELARRWR
ncbi:penicillin-binding protein 2 [Spiribacter vilamensis]|uniref:Peptidoglycan D,D-transpeptidase MrdA n=1 Tax=Spiribacter vilamensis TaxID=531306 RepID=A0A4Q8CY08_9GAMM|nr:penicillin-binding protein 2 [Spiribacter vilamensis]RZU97843.1 penicillin-binding protein 2 [Spiribacter vilamensis]TVO61235.1 penicillin-binding protein 2 [Spiribacter vilamensis]